MKAIQSEAFGNPAKVVKAVDVPDVGAPAAREVVIAVEASPINPSDLFMMTGGYGHRPRLPTIVGTEGVGRVVAVGAGVKHLRADGYQKFEGIAVPTIRRVYAADAEHQKIPQPVLVSIDLRDIVFH